MFVRLTHFAVSPDKMDEIKKIYHSEIAPLIYQQDGIKEVLLLEPVDEADEFISCTIWASEKDTRVFESSDTYPVIFGKVKAAATAPPRQKYYNTSR